MSPKVRGSFDTVEILLRLLMVVPASTAETELSFSSLRRLKTWLRTTMTQKRLNGAAVCTVHKEQLDKINFDIVEKRSFTVTNDEELFLTCRVLVMRLLRFKVYTNYIAFSLISCSSLFYHCYFIFKFLLIIYQVFILSSSIFDCIIKCMFS